MDINLKDYKGIIFVGLVVAAIIFFSHDLEGVLLMTGIIVNIIAICLNTGVTNFKDKKLPKKFLPARRYDLIKKHFEKEKFEPVEDEKKSEDRKKDVDVVIPYVEEKYKGAIDYEDCTGRMYPETATDNIANLAVKHQGINTKRQIAGAMRRKKMMVPYVAQELKDEEDKDWWGSYDM